MSATIDHVTVRSSDLDASLALFTRAFELLGFDGQRHDGVGFYLWDDFSIAAAQEDRPPTRNLHVAFGASSHAQVDEWWRALTVAGYTDDGAPGPRAEYGPTYYGAFIRDHDRNSIEAVHHETSVEHPGLIDHLWVRVSDLGPTRRFYEAVSAMLGVPVRERPERLQVAADNATFSLLEGQVTENLHLAFGVADEASVDAFHAAGMAVGGRDNGAPGELPEHHPGYYAAFLLDPDGNNIEAVCHNR